MRDRIDLRPFMTLNRGFAYREQIGANASGRTVLAHLIRTRRHSTAGEWAARIERGEVEVDGRAAAAQVPSDQDARYSF